MRRSRRATRMHLIRTFRVRKRWRIGFEKTGTRTLPSKIDPLCAQRAADWVNRLGRPVPSMKVCRPSHRLLFEATDRRSRVRRQVVGTYILRPNQSGGGSHVANAAFMVASNVRGQGIGRAMSEHCLSEARRFGFRAMQFNFVVSTNDVAVRLWKRFGFKIVGTLPSAFRHPEKGYVDVYVMFRSLL